MTSDTLTVPTRIYQLNPPDRTGALLGLSTTQVAVIGVGVIGGTLAMTTGVPVPLALAWMAVAVTAGGLRVRGVALVDVVPSTMRWVLGRVRRQRWYAPLPLLGDQPALPPVMAGQRILSMDGDRFGFTGRLAPIAIVHDRRSGTIATTVRAAGGEFALLERADQDHRVQLWGDALAGFCRAGTPIREIRCTQWAAPGGMAEHRRWIAEHGTNDDTDSAWQSYQRLLTEATAIAARQEILITLVATVGRAARRTRARNFDRLSTAIEAVLTETRLLVERLAAAGLRPTGPLAPAEIATAIRARLDPSCLPVVESLAERAGLVEPSNAGPLVSDESSWQEWRADSALHRAFYVAEWPRTPVIASWMSRLLQHGGPARAITVCYQPIDPQASRNAIRRQASKIESDVELRQQKGYRVSADHRRAHQAVHEREQELVDGFGELAFAGVVSVTGHDLKTLDADCNTMVNVAAGIGIELRPLHGRHAQATSVALPLARGLAPKGLL